MRKKIYIMALALLCAAMTAVSCIYPFTPETEDGSGALVIEGDILIGKESVIQISRTAPLSFPEGAEAPPTGKVWVENDAGAVINGVADPSKAGSYTVDTRYADSSKEYRLHFLDNESGKEYVSDWGHVCKAPVIDSLSYNLNYEKAKLNIALSMHSLGESFFKWSYVEDWEYHSLYYAELKATYNPGSYRVDPSVTLTRMEWPESTFTCYKHAVSSRIMTFSTEGQTDDRFVDLEFLPIDQDDNRISYLYRIVVDLEPITKDAYLYWENIKSNSEYNGSLFAPTPSELVGNIHCVQEPNEMVMGYINVAEIARKELVVQHLKANFYKPKRTPPEEILSPSQWVEYYENYYLPYACVTPGVMSETYWAVASCVDCRLLGGTFDAPDNWPPIDL